MKPYIDLVILSCLLQFQTEQEMNGQAKSRFVMSTRKFSNESDEILRKCVW